MEDRELLEMAAKAAGLEIMEAQSHGLLVSGFIWNPLKDDGDAMRLACKLKIWIEFLEYDPGDGYTHTREMSHTAAYEDHNDYSGGCLEATRRAIVRSAAEIGKAMK